MIPRSIRRCLAVVFLLVLLLPPSIVGPFVLVDGRPPWDAAALANRDAYPFEVSPEFAAEAPETAQAASQAGGEPVFSPEEGPPVLGDPGGPGEDPPTVETPPAASSPRSVPAGLGALAEGPVEEIPPPAAKPLAVRILAPQDAVCGDTVRVTVVITGQASAVKFSIERIEVVEPEEGRYVISTVPITDYIREEGSGGRTVGFSNRHPGTYKLTVAVAGPGTIEIAVHDITMLPGETTQAPTQAADAAGQPATIQALETPPAGTVPEMTEPPDARAIVQGFVAQVPTANRKGEAQTVGGCFRITANRIQTKAFPAGEDPLLDVARQVAAAMGTKAAPWTAFLGKIGALRAALVQLGQMDPDDLEQQREFLSEVANVLAAAE